MTPIRVAPQETKSAASVPAGSLPRGGGRPGGGKTLLVSAAGLPLLIILAAAYLNLGAGSDGEFTLLLCFAFLGAALLIGIAALVGEEGKAAGIDLRRPASLYLIFYTLYYPFPLFVFLIDPWVTKHNAGTMSWLIAVGYLGLFAGFWLSRCSFREVNPTRNISKRDAYSLLVLGYVMIGFVIVHVVYRLSIGLFYMHAAYYAQEASVKASILDQFSGNFYLPTVLVLCFAAAVPYRQIASRATLALRFYVLGILIVLVASSQFRVAFTVLVFLVAGRQITGKPARLKHLAVIATVCIASLLIIQGSRVIFREHDVASSGNQLSYSLSHSGQAMVHGTTSSRGEVLMTSAHRTSMSMRFLSSVIDGIEGFGHGHFGGYTFAASLPSLFPRILWPSKPVVVPTQLLIEQRLHLPLVDNSPGPVIQFYAEWGWPGVLIGFTVFAFVLGRLTRWAMDRNTLGLWMMVAWFWSGAAQVETELVLQVLVYVRHFCVVSAMLIGIRYLVDVYQRAQNGGSPGLKGLGRASLARIPRA